MFKLLLSAVLSMALLTACGDNEPSTSQTHQSSTQTSIQNNTSPVTAENYVPTKKYPSVKALIERKSQNFPATMIKESPIEFALHPEILPTSDEDKIKDDLKYAALEALLLTFSKTDVNEFTVHIKPIMWDNRKPESDAAKQAIQSTLTLHAKRDDVLAVIKQYGFNDFDSLIEHDKNNENAFAGESQSKMYNQLRSNSESSWNLINQFVINQQN